jgi:hypothetical protein
VASTKQATAAEVRAWAAAKGLGVGTRGRISAEVAQAFNAAHRVVEYAGSGK